MIRLRRSSSYLSSVPGRTPCARAAILSLSTLLIVASRSASAQLPSEHQAQVAAPLVSVGGAKMSSRCDGCLSGRFANPETRNDHYLVVVGGSRSSHVLVGLLGGLVVGAATGAIIGNSNAKHCHAESCQVSAALGGGFDIAVGALAGALAGAVVGAVWPVSK